MMNKRKIIMDCDPGVDDAIALAFAAAHPEAFELLAVTTVSGNLDIETVTKNALDLVEFYGLDVPVAKGMPEPLVQKPVYAPAFHGKNGLGDSVLPAAFAPLERENAVLFLHKVLTELPQGEQATLVVTGPMTNIALLFKVFPEVKEKIQEIVFMGGAACGGNVTAAAEFNIYVDPEAAKIVFHCGIPLVMCGLDVTQDCGLTRGQILKLCQSKNRIAKICGEMAGYSLENTNKKYRGISSIHDAVPFVYLLHPEFFAAKRAILDVDCSEGTAKGTTICDFRWWDHEEAEFTASVLMEADGKKFQECLITALYELGERLETTAQ